MPDDTHTPPRTDVWTGTDVIGQEVRDLPVVLTPDERGLRGQALALQLRAVADLERQQAEERKALQARQRADMAAALAERDRLRDAVNDGREPRPVTCVHLADFGRGICHTVRVDTSVLVDQRRLRNDEQQVSMAAPLRVVRDPRTGRLRRDDGRDVDTLPFVRPEHCAPRTCRECDERHGTPHAADCDLRGLGDASLVTRDQCEIPVCLECDEPLGSRHVDGCPHADQE